MKTIWKFVLDPRHLTLDMPQGAVVLTAREQRDEICIWAEVDPSAINEARFFDVFGTGHDLPTGMGLDRRYIGTAMLHGGSLVLHVYERTGI